MKNVFTRWRAPFRGFCVFLCPFYLESRYTAVCEVSKGKKWSVNPFQTLMCRKWNTHTVKWSLGITKNVIWVIKEQNLLMFVLRWSSEKNNGETWSFSLPGTWSKVSSTKKNGCYYFRQRSWIALVRSLFHKQCVYCQKSKDVQQSFHLGHRATLHCKGLKCQQKFA